jgi:hypothetical protein
MSLSLFWKRRGGSWLFKVFLGEDVVMLWTGDEKRGARMLRDGRTEN